MKADKITEKFKKTGKKMAAFGRTFRISFLLLFLAALTAAAAIFLSWRYLTNRYYLSRYAQGEYKVGTEERLVQTINRPEGYIAAYNVGNGYYKTGNYERAEAYFRYALTLDIPEGKECDVRVNLALSLIGQIDFEGLETNDDILYAISILEEAREVLLEEGCATDENDGHDPEAQQLKNEIDKKIEELKEKLDQDQGDQDDQDDQQDQQDQNQQDQQDQQDQQNQQDQQDQQNQQQNQSSAKEQKIKRRLESQEKDIQKERQQQQQEKEQEQAREEQGTGSSGSSGSNEGEGENGSGKIW